MKDGIMPGTPGVLRSFKKFHQSIILEYIGMLLAGVNLRQELLVLIKIKPCTMPIRLNANGDNFTTS